jgi:hypothetical protein
VSAQSSIGASPLPATQTRWFAPARSSTRYSVILWSHPARKGIVAAITGDPAPDLAHRWDLVQTTTMWKASTDPDLTAQMLRVLDLYDSHPPTAGWSVSMSSGPAASQGQGLAPRRKPRRRRASYTRSAGVMHMLAALDLATGRLFYRIRAHKRQDRVPQPAQGAAHPSPLPGARAPVLGQFRASLCSAYSVMRAR